MSVPTYCRYTSAGGVSITRQSHVCEDTPELEKRQLWLDTQPGVLLSCASEYPGRFQKRELLLVNPPIQISALASAFRAQGVQLQTLRPSAAQRLLRQGHGEGLPDLVILSPGPGRPQDFDCAATLALCERFNIPVFGVCLGLQAMVEYAGGKLAALEQPVHGKPGLNSRTNCNRLRELI